MLRSVVQRLDQHFYPGVGDNWDDALLRDRVIHSPNPRRRVLDVGAGAGIVRQMDLRALGGIIHGADIDRRIGHNTFIHHACVADACQLPYAGNTFDLVVADNVLEHLAEPAKAFREVQRVLKPAGRFYFKTPNRNHYVPFLARVTPYQVHQIVAGLRGRSYADTFQTYYRANSAPDVRRLAAGAGLVVDDLRFVEGRPEYCRITPLLYVAGIVYERIVNATEVLAPARVVMLGTLRKQ